MDEKLDLRVLWSKPKNDPIFAYDQSGTIEDLIEYWGKMIRVYYDSGSGLIEIRTLAFEPDDAQRISEGIFFESSKMINELSAVAREDAVRYARDELDSAVERLKSAREAITVFRNDNRMVDPSVDMLTQASLLGTLQAQLVEALIELDLLLTSSQTTDPRVTNAERRVEVIEIRIEDERRKLGISGDDESGASTFSTLVGEYERLIVDQEFAERSYISSLATHDIALAEAQRKSRYLAAHIKPTLAERSLFPQRLTILSLFAFFMFLTWAISALVFYSLKDRR
jgi:capsular polysaccharide transport system permease protein